jgi:hypothetical protein
MSPSLHSRETRAQARELKFVVSAEVGAEIREWARTRLRPDPNGAGDAGDEYLTTSLYFDTFGFDVLRRQGSFGRMKYRARRYGDSGEVFLERKLRNARMLSKRRTTVPLAELSRITGAVDDQSWAGAWFQRRLQARSLQPICQISYARTARVAAGAHGTVRLTIDDDIRALGVDSCEFRSDRGVRVLDGAQIVELKFLCALPTLFKHLAEEFRLSPLAVSKYRLGARALGHTTVNPAMAARFIDEPVFSRLP